MRTYGPGPGVARGLTFFELIVSIVVMGVLLVLAVPSLQDSIKNNRVAGQTNELIALINLARNEAIRRNVTGDGTEVVLRLDRDGTNWSANVAITDADSAPDCPPGVIRCAEHENVELSSDPGSIPLILRFNNRGHLEGGSAGNTLPQPISVCLKHKDCSGTRQHIQINVFGSGRVQRESHGCGVSCSAPSS